MAKMSAPRHTSRIGSCPTWPASLAPSGSSARAIPCARTGPTDAVCSAAIPSSRQYSVRVLHDAKSPLHLGITNVDVRQLDPRPRPMSCCFHDRKAICGFGRGDLGRLDESTGGVGSSRDLDEE